MAIEAFHGVAVAVAVDRDGPLAGALLLGRSGAGKSRLALDLVDACPFGRTRLVADDIVDFAREGGSVVMSAPKALRGLVEQRGFGIMTAPSVSAVRLTAVFDLETEPGRLSVSRPFASPAGGEAPLYPARGFDAARIRRALRAILSTSAGEAAG